MLINQQKFDKNYKRALEWSNFKHKIYNECKRKFLYSYFNVLVKPSLIDTVQKLKKLKTLNEWKGYTLHKYIDISVSDDSFESALLKFEREYLSNIKEAKNDQILEYYYNYPVTNYQLEEINRVVKIAIRNFWFYYTKEIRNKGYIRIPKPEFSIDLQNNERITILFVPDYVLQDNQQNITIFEWKTSENSSEQNYLNQLKLYYLVYSSIYKCNSVFVNLVSLYPSLNEKRFSFSTDEINDYISFIKFSYTEIKDFLDSCRMFYLEAFEDLFSAISDKFPKTTDTSLCKFCKFRGLCFGNEY